MADSLRGGVIGAGVFGGYHARQYSRLPDVVLSAVLDLDPERAAAVAVPLGGRGFHDLAAFLDAVDVVTVASPATLHAEHALAALAAGKPVYVEKPIAITLAAIRSGTAGDATAAVTVRAAHSTSALSIADSSGGSSSAMATASRSARDAAPSRWWLMNRNCTTTTRASS